MNAKLSAPAGPLPMVALREVEEEELVFKSRYFNLEFIAKPREYR